jgi:hypothetical protein
MFAMHSGRAEYLTEASTGSITEVEGNQKAMGVRGSAARRRLTLQTENAVECGEFSPLS